MRYKRKPIALLGFLIAYLLFTLRAKGIVSGELNTSSDDIAKAQRILEMTVDSVATILTLSIAAIQSVKNYKKNSIAFAFDILALTGCIVCLSSWSTIIFWQEYSTHIGLALVCLSLFIVPNHSAEKKTGIAALRLLKTLWRPFWKWCRNWGAIVLVVIITGGIAIRIHTKVYSGEALTQEALLSAYTEYLSFIGAFALGYYLYKREEIKNHEVLKKKARLILESMEYIQMNLESLDAFIDRGETYPIADNWRSDYLDIKHLVKHNEHALGNELQYFFGRVEAINKAIAAGDKNRAKKLYSNFIHKEKYSNLEFNYMDAENVMLCISLDIPQGKTWKEKEKEQIAKYAEDFFDVVNLRIYNYLIKNRLSSCEANIIEDELVEWLLQHPELSAWVKHPYEKRKITAVVFEIAISMKEKSPNLTFSWGEYSIK